MKYLLEEYWEKFIKKVRTKDGKEKLIHDGHKFEDLIGDLLNLLYQDVHWEKTKMTHDGSKDFLGEKEDGSFIWAECKNYKEKISLKVVAPTLVMAEIKDIQEIMVFSYSAINENTKKKLLYYADKREKRIYYYDDENLEKLLFRFRTKIFPKFFETFEKNAQLPLSVDPYVFSCSMPGIYYNNQEDFTSLTFSIKLNDLVFVGIGIINNNYAEQIHVELLFNDYNDLEYMEVVDFSVDVSNRFNWNKQIILNPGEARLCKLYFRPVRFKKELLLPSIKVLFLNSDIQSKIIKFKKIACNYLFNVPLIGSRYIYALRKLNDITINKSKMSLALFYGKSGVGKSRLLQESLSVYVRNHYHILNFTIDPLAKDSLYMLREIIYFIYNLTPELVIESLKEYKEEDSLWGTEQLEIIGLLQNAFNSKIDIFLKKLSHYKYFIFEKILSQRNVFIIDNIQFAEPFFVEFLYDLCVYAKSYQRNTQFVLILSCNLDYHCNSSIKKIRILSEELNNHSYLNVFLHEVEGMKQNDLALGFLKQLIQTNDENNTYLKLIVQKANYIPKYIENIVEYLLNKQLLNIENNYFIINNLKDFYNIVDCIPESFSEIFRMRFKLFLAKEHLSEDSVMLIISAIHFFGYVSREQVLKLHLELKILQQLLLYGFIDENNSKKIQFNHDLYEQFFMDNYTLEEIFLDYIIKENLFSNYNFSSWQKVLILTKQDNKVSQSLQYTISSWENISDQIPYKIKKFFYSHIIFYLSLHSQDVENFDEYMTCARKICLESKNKLGISFSNTLFESIYNAVNDMNIQERESSTGYQQFIYEYSENLLQGNNKKVLQIFKQRIEYLSQNYESNYKLLARLYNRIYVYYKNKRKEKTVHKYLEKSLEICKQKKLLGLEIENLYDEGNYYLFESGKKDCLIDCWSKGYSLFNENRDMLEYLTLNSLKKKIQVDLFCNEYDDIEDYLELAFDYIETGQFNQQSLFFNASFYYLEAIYGLLSNNIDNKKIQELIDLAGKYYVLKNNEKPYTIHFLYAKLAYKVNRYQEMLSYYNNALQNLDKKHYYYKNIKKIILDDCCFKIGTMKKMV